MSLVEESIPFASLEIPSLIECEFHDNLLYLPQCFLRSVRDSRRVSAAPFRWYSFSAFRPDLVPNWYPPWFSPWNSPLVALFCHRRLEPVLLLPDLRAMECRTNATTTRDWWSVRCSCLSSLLYYRRRGTEVISHLEDSREKSIVGCEGKRLGEHWLVVVELRVDSLLFSFLSLMKQQQAKQKEGEIDHPFWSSSSSITTLI